MAQIRKSLLDIVDYCGMDAARDLVQVWGGIKIYIPRCGSNAHMDKLSPKTRQALCEYFSGEYVHVPKSVTGDPNETRTYAKSLAENGFTKSEIAQKLDITERQVYRLLKGTPSVRRKKVDERQIDLEDYLKE